MSAPALRERVDITHRPGVYTVRLTGVAVARFTHLESGQDLVTDDPSTDDAARASKRDARDRARQLAAGLRRALGIMNGADDEQRLERLADAFAPAVILRRQIEQMADQVDRDPETVLMSPQEEAWSLAETHIAYGRLRTRPEVRDQPTNVIDLSKLPKGPNFEAHKLRGDEENERLLKAAGVKESKDA